MPVEVSTKHSESHRPRDRTGTGKGCQRKVFTFNRKKAPTQGERILIYTKHLRGILE